jgi:predicted nucleic acid-binding protein
MDNLVLVDTSVWICFFARKGFPEIKEAFSGLLDKNRVAIAGPILVELIQGARTDKEKKNIRNRIKGLHWLQITDEDWHNAADLSFNLRRKGVTPSAIDSLLAATAITCNCQIFHKDSDFDFIAKHSTLKIFSI